MYWTCALLDVCLSPSALSKKPSRCCMTRVCYFHLQSVCCDSCLRYALGQTLVPQHPPMVALPLSGDGPCLAPCLHALSHDSPSTRCMHSKLLSPIFVSGSFCLSTSISPRLCKVGTHAFFFLLVCPDAVLGVSFCYLCPHAHIAWDTDIFTTTMVNCAPQWQVFVVAMNVTLLPSWGNFILSMFLPCECTYSQLFFLCLRICRLGLEFAPTTCMGFRLLATLVPVEF